MLLDLGFKAAVSGLFHALGSRLEQRELARNYEFLEGQAVIGRAKLRPSARNRTVNLQHALKAYADLVTNLSNCEIAEKLGAEVLVRVTSRSPACTASGSAHISAWRRRHACKKHF